MKINIITCHTPFNYGAVLQCYALSSFLINNGYEVKVIDYVTPSLKHRNIFFATFRCLVRYFDFKRCKRVFGDFLQEYIPLTPQRYHSIQDLKTNPPRADVYIAGSDQIWNWRLKNGNDDSFYLTFAPKEKKRISYAASIATEDIPEEMLGFYQERLEGFDYISIREKSTIALLNRMGIDKVKHVLDPIYLLDLSAWETFSDKFRPKEPYLLIYCFSRRPEYYDYARRLAKERGLKIYIISNLWSDRRFKNDCFFWVPTPQRFISLFQNADCVVTNSFHGLSFSILFEKEHHTFESLKGSVRIKDTLHLFGHESRLIVDGKGKLLPLECDYNFARKQKRLLSMISREFLLSSLL